MRFQLKFQISDLRFQISDFKDKDQSTEVKKYKVHPPYCLIRAASFSAVTSDRQNCGDLTAFELCEEIVNADPIAWLFESAKL